MRRALVFISVVACGGGTPSSVEPTPARPDAAVMDASPSVAVDAVPPPPPPPPRLVRVETPRGEAEFPACHRDADCDTADGTVCDPQWHACLLPNTAAITVPSCPEDGQRDPLFAPSKALTTQGPAHHSPSAILVDGGGLLVMYAQRGAGLGLARVDRKGLVSPDVPFEADPLATSPWLARSGRTVHAIWRTGATAVELATSRDSGAAWSAPTTLNLDSDCTNVAECITGAPMLATAKGGLVYAFYGAQGLRLRVSSDGGSSFGPPRTILPGVLGDVAIGKKGSVHVVALSGADRDGYGSANQRVEYTFSDGGTAKFSRARAVSMPGEKLPYFGARPALVIDVERKWLYVVYVRGGRDGTWDLVVAASKSNGENWVRTRIGDTPACALHMTPDAALDAKGRLHVTWYDGRGRGRYARATCKPGAASCAAQGRINDTPFVGLTTMRDSDRSVGTRATVLLDAPRKALHAIWAQPDESGMTRIRYARGSLPKQ